MCWPKWSFNVILCKERVYTFAQAYLIAFVTVPKSHVLPQIAICVSSEDSGESEYLVTRQIDKYQDPMCWLNWRFNVILCEQ